jgi:hypothetical protein
MKSPANSAHTPANRPFLVGTADRGAGAEEPSGPLVGLISESTPWLVTSDREDPFAFARRAAAVGAGREGSKSRRLYALFNGTLTIPFSTLIASHAPAQRLSMPNPALVPPACTNSTPPLGSNTKLPISFLHAQFLAEHQYSQPPLSTGPPPAGVAPSNVTAQIPEDLRTLASWPRLRNATLPDPIVGGIESDPAGIADRHGVKGMPVYTAFIDPDADLPRCRVCGDQSSDMALATLHQRHERHFQQ